MFRKLISNLPFQPSLLGAVSEYLTTMNKELKIRKYGLVLLLIGFCMQLFIIMVPAQSSVATHPADIVYGANSKAAILNAYRRNEDQLGRKDIQEIYNHYGIAEAQIQNSEIVYISESIENLIVTSRTSPPMDGFFVKIDGATNQGLYEYPLSDWNKSLITNKYEALTGLSSYGFRFWILPDKGGTIVTEKGARKPNLEILNDRITGSQVKLGNEVEYEIRFRNAGPIRSENTKITDKLPNGLEFVSYSSNIDLNLIKNGNELNWVPNNDGVLNGEEGWHYIKVIAKATVMNNNVCSNPIITGAGGVIGQSSNNKGACFEVTPNDCDTNSSDFNGMPGDLSKELSCGSLFINKSGSWNERNFNLKNINLQDMNKVDYYIDGNLVGTVELASSKSSEINYKFNAEGKYFVQAKLYSKENNNSEFYNYSVVENVTNSSTQDALIVTSISAENLSQGIKVANNTTTKAGDVIEYSISIQNRGSSDYYFDSKGANSLDVTDILEYSDITAIQDGELNKISRVINWDPVTLYPGQIINKNITIRIKDTIPNTPISSSYPLSYDYKLSAHYGSNVTLYIDKSPVKQIESYLMLSPDVSRSLSLVLFVILMTFVIYFYCRAKLIQKELKVIKKDFSTGGWK